MVEFLSKFKVQKLSVQIKLNFHGHRSGIQGLMWSPHHARTRGAEYLKFHSSRYFATNDQTDEGPGTLEDSRRLCNSGRLWKLICCKLNLENKLELPRTFRGIASFKDSRKMT